MFNHILYSPIHVYFRNDKQKAAEAGTPWDDKGTSYLHGTANSPLCQHIKWWHKALYIELVKEHGWANQLPYFKEEASQLAVTAISSVLQMPFSLNGILEKLMRFIVVNGQVWIEFILCWINSNIQLKHSPYMLWRTGSFEIYSYFSEMTWLMRTSHIVQQSAPQLSKLGVFGSLSWSRTSR